MCVCQGCGNKYKIDIIVSTDLWQKITPKPEIEDAGLLCPKCIGERLENVCGYASYRLVKIY